ncbi:MAG: Fe3+-citrate ABC transporter substrate-binding protein [Lachnospiraceae bacterium]|nr:Fe3+-citrate ABC transporter substrate-binding protein [Lachnospiraceae bacterium]
MKEKIIKVVSLMLVLVMVLSLAACDGKNSSSDAEDTTQADGTHVIVDHLDNEVEVPNQVDKVVVCGVYPLPSVLTIFFDSADKIVGMPAPSMTAAQNSLLGELYPEILNAKTDFIDGSTINIEELMKLEPDVVFYGASEPEVGEQLTNAGFTAVAVSVNKWNYDAIETLNHWIELLSEIFPENDKTDIVADYSDKVYKMVQDRVKDLSDEERANAFFLFKYDDTTMMTSGENFFGQWWCDAIGAKNVANELKQDNQVAVSMEQVYAWNPDLIYITNFTQASPDDLYNNAFAADDWSPITAVANHNVYKMPLGMYRSYTPGVDTPITLMWLAKQAYPSLFEDIDITEETVKYYKEVFGVDLTNEQAEKIFAPVKDAAAGF